MGVIKVKYETGEIVDFVMKDGNYYRGKILDAYKLNENNYYSIAVNKTLDLSMVFEIHEANIVQMVDKRKTGLPEEWCAEFRYAGSPHEKHMIEVFTNGLCFVFAEWLQKHLCNSKIVYLEQEHHYVVDFAGYLYDITGDVTEKFAHCDRRKAKFHGDWVRHR